MKCRLAVVIICLGSVTGAFGKVVDVGVKVGDKKGYEDVTFFEFDKKEKGPSAGAASLLYKIKWAVHNNQYKTCVIRSNRWLSSQSKLKDWVLSQKLNCLVKVLNDRNRLGELDRVLTNLQSYTQFSNTSPSARALKKSYLNGHLEIIAAYSRKDRLKAWKFINALEKQQSLLDSSQKSDLFKMAGDLAFAQQDLKSSMAYYLRSLTEEDSFIIRRKLQAIGKQLGIKDLDLDGDSGSKKGSGDESLIASKKESQLVSQIVQAKDKSAYLDLVKDGVELLEQFPSSSRAEMAVREIGSVLRSVSYSSSKKAHLLKTRIFKVVKKANGGHLLEWAESLFERSYYEEAADLAIVARKKLDDQQSFFRSFYILGMSYYYRGNYEKAKGFLEELVVQSVGREESVRGLFYLGLLNMRTKNYSKATFYFERILALKESYTYELSSRYWLWRAFINENQKEKAKETGDALIEAYPSSYFATRIQIARAESGDEKFRDNYSRLGLFPKAKGPYLVQLSLTPYEKLAWDNYLFLKSAGWYEEAQEELKELPQPTSSLEKLLYARLWGEVKAFNQSFIWLGEAWGGDIELLNENTIHLSFPRLYQNSINKWSAAHNFEPEVIMALIKQESSFMREARSPANALGLMQLVRVTAYETAKKLSFKKFDFFRHMQEPDTNIRFGTHYLNRMVKVNKGHLGFGLAYYNAGIGNVYKWLSQRKDLLSLREELDRGPDSDLWIEELPWSETRYYVKAVLRNYLIYRYINGKSLPEGPVWYPYLSKAP